MSAPRFSVLLPTSHRPETLGLAIQSVLNQTVTDFELLIVGDGVTDATREVIAGFSDARLRWFDLPKGPGFGYANRNVALRQSRGELIAYAADDDLMLPDHLEQHGATFGDTSVDWTMAPALWVSSDGVAAPDLTNLDLADERDYFAQVANTISGGCVVYRATAFDRRDVIPESLPSGFDWYIFRDLLARFGPPARIDEPTLLHFTTPWKNRRDSHFSLLRGFLGIADRAAWWPALLKPALKAGELPQNAYFERLRSPDGARLLRQASRDVTNRVALDRLAPRTAVVDDHQRLQLQIDALASEVAALKRSRSWRVTRPLRAIARLLRGRKA